jgi:hypothetical protein
LLIIFSRSGYLGLNLIKLKKLFTINPVAMIKKIHSFMDKSFWKQVNKTVDKFETKHPLVKVTVGLGLVIVGIVGIILPVMPGWIFLIPGLILIFPSAQKYFKK